MARKRDEEDVFKPLNDSPGEEDDSQLPVPTSRRGWEVKIGLLTLVLLVGAAGYFAYAHLTAPVGTQEAADASGGSKVEDPGDRMADAQVSLAQVTAVAQPEPIADHGPAGTTEWAEVSDSQNRPGTAAWTAPQTVEEQAPPSVAAVAAEPYAANYGVEAAAPQSNSPAEATFAPMPNPSDFTAGTSVPATPAASIASAEPGQSDAYGAGSATGMSAGPSTDLASSPAAGPGVSQAEGAY
ncbi:MAG: hypothetical protein ACYC6Y_22475 [Thermoguttaceae bacterium]